MFGYRSAILVFVFFASSVFKFLYWLIYLFTFLEIFIYLAMPGLSCGIWDLFTCGMHS